MRQVWCTGLISGAAVAVAALAFSQSIRAQGGGTPATGRLACVNLIYVLNEYQRQKDLLQEFNALRDRVQAEDKARKDKIDTLQAELDRLDPNDPTVVQRMREMLALQIDFKNWRELKQADAARELGLWQIRVYKEVLRTIEEVARRDGYDLVLYKGEFEAVSMDPEVIKDQIRSLHLLYANPAVDITQVVLDKVNADYRSRPKEPMLLIP